MDFVKCFFCISWYSRMPFPWDVAMDSTQWSSPSSQLKHLGWHTLAQGVDSIDKLLIHLANIYWSPLHPLCSIVFLSCNLSGWFFLKINRVSLYFYFLEKFVTNQQYYFFKCLVEFTRETIWWQFLFYFTLFIHSIFSVIGFHYSLYFSFGSFCLWRN